ncbi:hypothetical protein OC834_002905 [Tilletia horrida]|nr:hypothetical protein OC834_002905 [Tilletia horrida]
MCTRAMTMANSRQPDTLKDTPAAPSPPLRLLYAHADPVDILLNLAGLIAAVAAGATQPLMNIPFGNITSRFVQSSGPDAAVTQNINHSVVNFLYLAAATFVAVYVCLGTWIFTGERITSRMRRAYLAKLMQQEVEFHSQQGAGILTARMDSDFQNIQNGISEKVALNVMYLSCCITGFAVAIARSWRLGLSLLPMLPALVIITLIFSHLAVKYTIGVISALSGSAILTDEALSAIKTVHSLGAADDFLRKHRINVAHADVLCKKRAWSVALCTAAITFVIYSGYALAFFHGAILLRRGQIEAGIIITVFLSIMMGSFALSQIPNSIQTFASAWSSLRSVHEVLSRTPRISSPPNARPASVKTEIAFNSVSFVYPSRPDGAALANFDLCIRAGRTTAIVGSSGSFKSTLCLLLERFYDPQSGSITLDGADLRTLDLTDLRGRCVSMVSQDVVLLQGTILDNVLCGLVPAEAESIEREGVNAALQARVEHACRQSDAHEFITSLPQGYYTHVGTGGLSLSGGQRARLAIARALIREPELLILDEATANLDMISERAIHESLQKGSGSRTTIVVAHRLSAIRSADHIILMQAGHVVAQGSHDELLRSDDDTYRKLLQFSDLAGTPALESTVALSSDKGGVRAFDDDGERGSSTTVDDTSVDAAVQEKNADALTAITAPGHAGNKVELVSKSRGPEGQRRLRARSAIFLFVKLAPASVAWLIIGLLGCLGAGLTYPAFAIVYGQAYSTFSESRSNAQEQTLNALWFFLVAICGSIAIVAQFVGTAEASARFSSACRIELFARLLRKPISYFDDEAHSPARLAKIVGSAPEATEKVTGVTMGSFVSSGITLVGGAIVALSYNWKFALVNLSVVPLTLLTGVCRLKIIEAKEQRLRVAHDPSTALASEAVSAFRTIASLAQEERVCDKFGRMLDGTRRYARRMAMLDTAVFALAQTNMFFVIALGFWYGGQLISRGELSQREFFVVFIAIVSGSFQCVNLLSQTPEVSQAKLAFAQINSVLNDDDDMARFDREGREPGDARPDEPVVSAAATLKLDNVHFAFGSRKKAVLQGVNVECAAAGHLAICGPSGSGKSTTIALIERFYEPDSGRVSFDGRDVSSFELGAYRACVSLVTQEPVLFSGTIEDNLRLGRGARVFGQEGSDEEEALREAMREALKEANLITTIDGLPDGIKTDLGSKGITLSGGQRQRLVLARALLKRPKLLLLDEATSALDFENQATIQAALDAATESKERTTVSVVHRLETLRKVPHIAVMQDGRVVEEGTFDELAGAGAGLFAQMLRSGGSAGWV